MIISTDALIVVIAITAIVLLIALGAMLVKKSFLLLTTVRTNRPIETDETAAPARTAHRSAARRL